MARIRDLGINAIPGTMRPLEIGPGAAYEIQAAEATPYLACAATNCEQCVCDGNSTKADTSLSCAPPTDCVAPTNGDDIQSGYHASGFTLESVAELKRQLRTRRAELEN